MISRRRTRTEIAWVTALFLLIGFLFSFRSRSVGYSGWRISRFRSHNETGVVNQYPYVKPSAPALHPPEPTGLANSTILKPFKAPDRLIILTKLEHEDASWLSQELQEWQKEIRDVNSSFALLRKGAERSDKGRIASEYLTYLIENYHNLPEVLVFLNTHPEQKPAESNKFSTSDKIKALSNLDPESIKNFGFANLRCASKLGCRDEYLPKRDPPDEFRTLEVAMPKVWKGLFQNDDVPEKLASPCCAEFAVSNEQIKKKGVQDYVRYWEWLNKTAMDDDTAGLALEYLWHIIFGQDAEYCSELQVCEL